MKILLVLAHPERKSLNGKLVDAAVETLKSLNHEIRVVDLFGIKFNPTSGRHDFDESKLKNPDHFDYQSEQKHALENSSFSKEIKEQQDNLRWKDIIIFQFPLYWGTMPAMLKGYIDRVFSYHFAYGGKGEIGGKLMMSVTTGGPKSLYDEGGFFGISVPNMLGHFRSQLGFIKVEEIPIFVAHGVNGMEQEKKKVVISDYIEHLKKNIQK